MLNTMRLVLPALSILALSACTTTNDDPFGKNLYLRGEMTWWEAAPQYRLEQVSRGVFMARAELKADGNPYRFKFADQSWQCGTNYGFKAGNGIITAGGEAVRLTACSQFDDLKIIPTEDGVYEFYLDIRGDEPVAYVKKSGIKPEAQHQHNTGL